MRLPRGIHEGPLCASKNHGVRSPKWQAHEQNNAVIKGDGGAVGLTDNPSALRRWMVGGPKICRVIQEFQTSLGVNQGSLSVPGESHHEQRKRFQENFKSDVASLIQDTGNPFLKRGTDFVTLHNDDIVDPVVHASLQKLQVLGVEQYEAFVRDRLTGRTKKTSDPSNATMHSRFLEGEGRKETAQSYQISSLPSLFQALLCLPDTQWGA